MKRATDWRSLRWGSQTPAALNSCATQSVTRHLRCRTQGFCMEALEVEPELIR